MKGEVNVKATYQVLSASDVCEKALTIKSFSGEIWANLSDGTFVKKTGFPKVIVKGHNKMLVLGH